MCGIIGAVVPQRAADATLREVRSALDAMAYRGPDGQGVLDERLGERRVVLGHRRLSILDLSSHGSQPMRTRKGTITYNGEVYNYRELRKRLVERAQVFSSDTDTEVVLRGLIEFGIDFVRELRGIFAFAFYDPDRGKLILARDRTGVKPLFFLRQADAFVFSSESKFLVPFLDSVELDSLALSYFLRLGYTPPGRSLFKNIEKLKPGTTLEIDVPTLTACRSTYYELPRGRIANGRVDVPQLRCEFESVIEEQMIADVPVGTFLSGGVDSTIVTMIASRLNPDLTAFTTRFYTKDRYLKFNLDYEMAVMAAKRFGIKLEVVDIDEENQDLVEHFVHYLTALDEPHANLTTFSTYMIARRAHEMGFKVLLCGDGADEVFGGYNRYRKARLLRRLHPLCLFHPKAASFFRGSAFQRYVRWHHLFSEEQIARLTLSSLESLDDFAIEGAPTSIEDMVNYYDMNYWISEESNTRVDRACMLNSIEARVPFQDHRLIDDYWPHSLQHKIVRDDEKIPLKRAFPELPGEISKRKKSGWNAPDSKWFRSFLKPYIRDLFSPAKLERQGILSPGYVCELVEGHLSGEYHRNELRTLISFQAWYDQYCD